MRTHTCGELNKNFNGKPVVICGWIDSVRDHGGVIFANVRDRYGVTQVVFDPKKNEDMTRAATSLHLEDVVKVKGVVSPRPDTQINKNMPTGEIEVVGDALEILNSSKPTPFVVQEDVDASEDLRLKYRYLDLRRKSQQDALLMRHKAAQIARNYLSDQNFVEVETPMLTKSTPEGARDYLVPSRIFKGRFFALPQSPQLFKQLLMVAGMDRYFQVVRCFRDEDLRADRQPEFTQIDVEASFIDAEFIYKTMEEMIALLWKECKGITLKTPFTRITYKEAIDKYGIDRPDRRIPWELADVSQAFKGSGFQAFAKIVESGGIVKGFNAAGFAEKFSRKDTDELIKFVEPFGAKGVVSLKVAGGEITGGITKFLGDVEKAALIKTFNLKDGDIFFLVGDKPSVVNGALAALRVELGTRLGTFDKKSIDVVWVTDFPLLGWSEEDKRYVALHHPFTSPHPDDMSKLESDPANVRAVAYDLVMNGSELGGGSIRIHNTELQKRVFKVLGIGDEEAREKFGFLLDAFSYGAPPHGGLAFGLDRIIMLLGGFPSIRDVIAFPKTTSSSCLMTNAPSNVDDRQLSELGLAIKK